MDSAKFVFNESASVAPSPVLYENPGGPCAGWNQGSCTA